jgi:hypothetical protein
VAIARGSAFIGEAKTRLCNLHVQHAAPSVDGHGLRFEVERLNLDIQIRSWRKAIKSAFGQKNLIASICE